MKRTIAFFGIASALVMFSAVGFTYAAGSGVRTQIAGKQLLLDGDMEKAGTTNWTGGNTILTKESGGAVDGSRVLRVTNDGTYVYGNAWQRILTTGKTYRITGWTRSDGVTKPMIMTGTTGHWVGTTSTNWQKIDATFAAKGDYLYFRAQTAATIGQWQEWDDIVVTEVPAQTVTGGAYKTEVGSKQRLNDGDMEKAIVTADFPNIILNAGISKVSGGATDGKRVLQLNSAVGAVMYCSSSNKITTGKTYRLTGWARGDGTGVPIIHDFLVGNIWVGTSSADWQKINHQFTAKSGYLCVYVNSTNHPVQYDDLVVTEYLGKTIPGSVSLTAADADMEKAGTVNWAGFQAISSKVPGSAMDGKQVLRISYDGSHALGFAFTPFVLTKGKTYRVTGWARGDGSARPRTSTRGTSSIGWTGTMSTEWQRINIVGVSDTSNTYALYSDGLAEGRYVEFDDVIITEM